MERYAAFRERMTEELKKEFPDIAVRVIDRENGVKKEGFVLGGETGHIASPVIYLDELFALYEDEELTVRGNSRPCGRNAEKADSGRFTGTAVLERKDPEGHRADSGLERREPDLLGRRPVRRFSGSCRRLSDVH